MWNVNKKTKKNNFNYLKYILNNVSGFPKLNNFPDNFTFYFSFCKNIQTQKQFPQGLIAKRLHLLTLLGIIWKQIMFCFTIKKF